MDKAVDPITEAFATVLRKRRRELGLSQEELAHRAGISMRYVSLLESVKFQPTISTMQALAVGLEVKLSDMIKDAEDLPPR